MTGVRTTCPYCGVGCGVVATPDGKVAGDPLHPANRGRLCSKGAALAETLDDTERLLRPRVDGQETGWGEALDHVAKAFSETIAAHGPEAVAFYVSGQLLTEDYYVANKLMKGFIGAANIDTNSRLCMASTAAGHVRAFGEDVVPGIYEDWDEADLVVLVGSNTAWCHPVLYDRLARAHERRGTRVVTIDPRRSATAEISDMHLALAAGSDVALFNGLLVHLADHGHIDRDWTGAHTNGLEAALEAARVDAGALATVAAITGLAADEIAKFYDWFAATERTVTVFSQGVNQSSAGTDKVNAIINCHLATGRIGRPGMGPFSVTGQPNAMGGREVGGFANQLAAHVGFDDPVEIARVAKFWGAPRMTRGPGHKAVEMFEAVGDGRIKAIWIMATNPAASMPRSAKVRAALRNCPLVVVSDCWETDTTAFAHVVLPAAGWGEKDGTVTNSERRISRQRAFRKSPGEARPDWWMMTEVARRMGWAQHFAYDRPGDIFREHAALSSDGNNGRRLFNIGALAGLTAAAYDALDPVRWPAALGQGPGEAGRMFADGRFSTADGRARVVPTPWRPPTAIAGREYPFMLNTGRIRDQWHTMTRTGRVPRLMTHQDEPILALHPHDAGKVGVAMGDLVRIETEHGAAVLRVQVSKAQRIGEVFAPMHWTEQFATTCLVNNLVTGARDPVSGQPELKATPARLSPVPTLWRGLYLSHASEIPAGEFYSVRIPLARGHAFELRGWEPLAAPDALLSWAGQQLNAPHGALRRDEVDSERGVYRFTSIVAGRLDACLFLARGTTEPVPERDAAAALLGEIVDDARLAEILTIGEAGTAPKSAGAIICACFSVRLATIRQAIIDDRLTTVAEIGKALRAGTNCGTCTPELSNILREITVAAG